jgi:hypothetical protein
MTELREKSLAFAISHYLSNHPENISFDDIIYMVRENEWSEDLTPWEPFQDCAGEWIADEIEIMASLLEVTFG